jgi:hypothetical protein
MASFLIDKFDYGDLAVFQGGLGPGGSNRGPARRVQG